MISAFRAVFGSLFHATHHFGRKNYFNKVTGALCQNNFLTNLFHTTRHSERSEESLKKISKPHDCIPFNTGKILKQVQDDSTKYVDTWGFARILEGVTHFLINLFHTTRHSERSGATHVDTLDFALSSTRHSERSEGSHQALHEILRLKPQDDVYHPTPSTFDNNRRAAFTLAEGATHVNISNNNRHAAFTLAEVLITLGIIGVVAALTIPNLIHTYNSIVLKSQLKKTYSVLSGAINMMYAQTGIPVTPKNYTEYHTFYKDFMKYVKVAKDCGFNQCAPVSYDKIDTGTLEGYQNFTFTADMQSNYFDDGQLILQDGTFLLFEDYLDLILISADINGINKGPNALGHDLFTFELLDNKLVPSGAEGTTFAFRLNSNLCSYTETDYRNGLSCTEKALKDPDYFKNLPKP